MQPEPAVGEVLADHRHVEVAAVASADRERQPVAEEPGGVGAPAHLLEQLLPLWAGQAAALPVGASVLAAVVEVLGVLDLERSDLRVDEGVELGEERGEVVGEPEVHGQAPAIRRSCPTQ